MAATAPTSQRTGLGETPLHSQWSAVTIRRLPTVFFSYTHDSDAHRERVRVLADRLRGDLHGTGIEVVTDHVLPPGGPDEDFRRWSEQHAQHSEIVIPVFNDTYRKCWDGQHPPGMRAGGTNEATVIAGRVNSAGGHIAFLRVVLFDAADRASIPDRISNMQHFLIDRDYATLHAWVRVALHLPPAPAVLTVPPAAGSAAAAFPPLPATPMAVDRQGFVNCNPVFTAFESMLTSGASQPILLLRGPGEHGKSRVLSLLWQHARSVLGTRSSATIQFKQPTSSPEDCVRDIARALGVPAPVTGSINERVDAVLDACVSRPVVLFFDVYDEAEEHHRHWVRRILARCTHDPHLRCVVAGREVPQHEGQLWEDQVTLEECDLFRDLDSIYDYACSLGFCGPRESIQMLVTAFVDLRDQHGLSPKTLLFQIQRLCQGGAAPP